MQIDKIKEFFGYMIAIVIVIAVSYYTGFLEGFTLNDFKNTGQKISNLITKNPEIKYAKRNNVQQIGNYKVSEIPLNVLKGLPATSAWNNIFNSNKKVIFYVYDAGNDNFHSDVSNYISKAGLKKYYNINDLTKTAFKSTNMSSSPYAKISNNIQEFNEQRNRASNYTVLANFMESCAKTICIINPQRKQYIRLNSRNVNDTKRLLEGLKNW